MLAGVSVGAFTVFYTLVSGQDENSAVLTQLARQRVLVQRVAVEAMALVDAQGEAREAHRATLRQAAQAVTEAHRAADYATLGHDASKQINQILYGEPHHLNRQVQEFVDAVNTLTELPSDMLSDRQPLLVKVETMAGGALFTAYDVLFAALAGGIQQRVDDLRIFALVGEGLFLFLLVIMAWKVFGPLLQETTSAFGQLSALENYHRSVVNSLADGVMVVEPERRYVESLNPAAQEIFHIDEAAAVGFPLAELIPVSSALSVEQLRQWNRREVEGHWQDGSPFHLEVTMRDAPVDGKERLIAVVRDVTKQVEAEERVFTLNHALDQSAASVVITDIDGTIQYANPRAAEISGYSREELVGQSPRLLQSGLTPVSVYGDLWHRLRSGEEWRGEMLNRKKTGELYWEFLVISPLRNSRGEITQYMAVMEDITDRKLMEDALVVAKQQAERASRTKSDFLASMSHELRTPLNAIIGYSEFIDTEPFGALGHAKYREYLGHIHESGRHLLELINDMLDLSKVEAGKLALEEEEVDLSHSIQAAMHLVLERANRRSVRLSAEVEPNLPHLYVDNLRIKQIMLNLLTNAIKFTPEGGEVALLAKLEATGGIAILVRDTGIGIASEDIAKVLEPFGQVVNPMVRREDGTGLGLPITKRLAELHGGTVSIDSTVNVGTTVTVRLPASRTRPLDVVAEAEAP